MATIQFTVVPFARCIDEVIAFRNVNRSIQRDRAYFEWRYLNRPCSMPAHIVWCRDIQGRALGSASIIAHDFFVRDRVRPLGVLGDVSVLPECRGQGIGACMIAALQNHPALSGLTGCLVLPNDAAASSFARARWCETAKIERLVRVLDVGPRLRGRLGSSWLVEGLARAFNIALRWRAPLAAVGEVEVIADQCGDFGVDYDELWAEVDKHDAVVAVRNRVYLQWRYSSHPTTLYSRVALRCDGRLRAWVVFHLVDHMLHVDDFLAIDTASGMALIDALVRLASSDRLAATIQVNATRTARTHVPWIKRGFILRRDFQQVMTSPSSQGEQPWFGTEDTQWRITAGDKDV